MSRHHSQHSYGHSIRKVMHDCYSIMWTVDAYVQGSRLRHPRGFSRVTDHAGAVRFAKRWDVEMPAETVDRPRGLM